MFEVIDEVKKVYPEDTKKHTEAQQQLVLMMDKAVPSLQPSKLIELARAAFWTRFSPMSLLDKGAELKQEDGSSWGVVAGEKHKRGKLKQNIHSALVVEAVTRGLINLKSVSKLPLRVLGFWTLLPSAKVRAQ